MIRMFARHPVADFGKWLDGYNKHADLRTNGGVKADAIYQAVDDPNDVTVCHDFETAEAAQTFMANPDLKSAMEELGVSGPPTIWITQEAG